MKDMDRLELLTKIHEAGFACLDMNLYLDTHPEDKNAIKTYNMLSAQFNQFKCMYESKYGPLTNFGYAPGKYPWQWVNEPWPWDNEFYEQ